MSARTGKRRKIIVNDSLYIWHISLDDDSDYYVCQILSEDKSLVLACPLKTEKPYVISMGRIFQNKKTDGRQHRYLLPFSVPEAITPEFISRVISWSLHGTEPTELEFDGKDVPI